MSLLSSRRRIPSSADIHFLSDIPGGYEKLIPDILRNDELVKNEEYEANLNKLKSKGSLDEMLNCHSEYTKAIVRCYKGEISKASCRRKLLHIFTVLDKKANPAQEKKN